jgi:hypothetical protein
LDRIEDNRRRFGGARCERRRNEREEKNER